METYLLGKWYQIGRFGKHSDFLNSKHSITWTLLKDDLNRFSVVFEYQNNELVTVINGIITITGLMLDIVARPLEVVELGKYEVIYNDYVDFFIIGSVTDLFILSRRQNISISEINKLLNIVELQGYSKRNIYLV